MRRRDASLEDRGVTAKGLTRRNVLATGTAAVVAATGGIPLFNIGHAWSQDVAYDGGIFDAGGAVLRVGEWPGFWQENIRKLLLDEFEADFNCKIEYDGTWPFYPKYIAGGPQNPPNDTNNWNLLEVIKTHRAGDYFVGIDEIKANVPNANDLWDFALETGAGTTWAYNRMCYFFNTDKVDPAPVGFKSFWEERFDDHRRGTYIAVNGLQHLFFMTACHVWGGDHKNLEAGYDAMRRLFPVKLSDFTGNMQTLLSRGEVDIAVMNEGEAYMMQDRGQPVGVTHWDEKKALLTQTSTISRYSEPMQKKLSYALLNRRLSPEFMTTFNAVFRYRPTNSKAKIPENMINKGVVNTADAVKDFWIPDWNWFASVEADVSEEVNDIFAG
jgi:putative spermidine/putrescine transport system substrate-binding protein